MISGPVFVSSGQTLIVSSSQTSNNVTVLSSGTEIVQSGGTTISTVVSSGGLVNVSGGAASTTSVQGGGLVTVSAGGTDPR